MRSLNDLAYRLPDLATRLQTPRKMKNASHQLMIDRILQGMLIAYALLAFFEMAIFAAVRSPLFCYPLVAFVAAGYVYKSAELRCKSYLRQLRLIQELDLCKNIPIPPPPRHRNIRYVQKYVQKGKYPY